MKKMLIGFLMLASAAGLFAQEAQQGLKLGGNVKTGLRFYATQEHNETDDPGKAENKDPNFNVWHDDAGAVRLDLEGSYTKDNYGVVFRLRFRPVELYNDTNELHNLLQQGYIWADFLNKMIHITGGKIDDSAWASAGDEGFHYSTGYGLRFEIKPIQGLNFGFFLNPGDSDPWKLLDPDNDTAKDGSTLNPSSKAGLWTYAKHFFMETGFGVKFEHEILDVAAGLRLDSGLDGLNGGDWNGWDILKDDKRPNVLQNSDAVINYGDDADGGLRFYIGFNVKAVDKLTLAAEAQFYNMGVFSKAGWIWINEKIAYDLKPITVGLIMHQRLFMADNIFVDYYDGSVTSDAEHSVGPRLTFKPYIDYALTEKWTVGCEIPIDFWPDIVLGVEVKPKVTYKLGDNASITGYYKFGVAIHDEHAKHFSDGTGGFEAGDPLFSHAVQVNFDWSF